MTIEDLQKEKQKLENQISEMINEFQKKCKIMIQDINILSDFSRTTDGAIQRNIKVCIRVNLF